ncbi:MAG TPA: 50S ribosomal protein L18 [Clostridiales bacterium]|nr:50S ribosomal protein L18 [Clostridiales bacterium]
MIKKVNRNEARKKRHLRIRKKISGTAEKPRFNVYKSNKHMYVQITDDMTGHTLVSASTLDPELRDKVDGITKTEAAKMVGELAARRAMEKGIKEVVFDRSGYIYHGRVKEVAEGARQAGLQF